MYMLITITMECKHLFNFDVKVKDKFDVFRLDTIDSQIVSPADFKPCFKRKTIVDLTVIDIIFKIFSLRDAHCFNIGLIDKHDSNIEGHASNQAKKWLKRGQDFRIIDFLPFKKKENMGTLIQN